MRSAERTRWPAYWASWADTLPMIRERHPEVADLIVYHLEGGAISPCLGSACRAATNPDGVDGFEVPSWSAVTAGQRPPIMEVEDREPGVPRQHAAAIRIESSFQAEILMRSQSGSVWWGPLLCLSQFLHSRESTQLCSGCFSSAASISPLPFVQSHLRVWQATRSFWPSPRSMFEDRGFGKEGLRSGECGRQSLQGSWEQSRDEHVCARHGLGGCLWLETTGVWKWSVGSGHHTRVISSWQWRTKTRSSNHGRCGPDPSQEAQREDLPGVDKPRGQGSLGGSRSGGWRASGQRKRSRLWVSWPKPAHGPSHECSSTGWNRRGD